MDETWLDKVSRRLGFAMPVVNRAVGLGFLRGWLGWVLGGLRDYAGESDLLGLGAKFFFDVGEVAGCLVCLALVLRAGQVVRNGPFLIGCAATASLGALCCGMGATGTSLAGPTVLILSVLAGAGYIGLFMLWVERLGCSSPLQVMLVCAGSYVVSGFAWYVMQPLEMGYSMGVALCMLLSSVLMYLASYVGPDCAAKTEFHRAFDLRESFKLCVWAWLFAFAYGVGASYTSMGYSSAAAKLGGVVAMLALIVAYYAAKDRFDFVSIYRISLLAMVGGFALSLMSLRSEFLMQLCFSASQAFVMTFAMTYLCGAARLRGSSAVPGYCVLSIGWYVCAIGTRYLSSWLLSSVDSARTLEGATVAVAIVVLLVGAVVVFKEVDFLECWKRVNPPEEKAPDWAELAEQAGLTPRERDIMVLLLRGLTQQQVSEQLFIAPGTARAHVNHIYSKLGVHSREELLELCGV